MKQTVRLVVVVIFLAFVGACGLLSYVAAGNLSALGGRAASAVMGEPDTPVSSDPTRVLFVVEPGQSATEIGEALARAGLVRNANAFRSAVRARGAESRIAAGEYELSPSMRPSEIVAILAEGRQATIVLTVPEGRRLAEIADLVALRTPITREAFLAELDVARWSDRYEFLRGNPAPASLEGYLFPDTYRLPRSVTAAGIVERMLDTFGRRVPVELRARAADVDLTFHQVLTLASIVEREAVLAEERPLIAGVYLNRLRAGMRLQADPTVQFGLLGPGAAVRPANGGYWKQDLSLADLEVVSPYNTYARAGLPPGPICNPGLASIQAVLEPNEHDYFYFVAREDGSHAFARTLAEHNANVARTAR